MKIRFTKKAEAELLRIVDVFNEYAGGRSADAFVDKVAACGSMLLKHPQSGQIEQLLSDRKKTYRFKYINDNYKLIYYVSKSTIWVVDFWDRRCDPLRLARRIPIGNK